MYLARYLIFEKPHCFCMMLWNLFLTVFFLYCNKPKSHNFIVYFKLHNLFLSLLTVASWLLSSGMVGVFKVCA